MATWRIRSTAQGLALEHRRPGVMGVFHCGLLRRDTELGLVVAFVVEAEASPGDLILLPDGQALMVLRPAPGKS